MGELAQQGIYACALPMPDPYSPKKEKWVDLISKSVENPNKDIYLVGHSLGSTAILRYLESLPETSKIGGVILVSGPFEILDLGIKDSSLRKIDNFLDTPFNFEHIKKICSKFVVIHGDNDSKVPFSHAKEFSKNLDCSLVSIHDGGHLGGSDGFYKLSELHDVLKVMIA
jgi:predicted alpha/beta hydrolase family esterase